MDSRRVGTEKATQAEIAKLHNPLSRDKYIGRFDICAVIKQETGE